MKKYLGSNYGRNIPIAIKCAKFKIKYGKPFTSVDIGVSGQTLRNIAAKGIISKVKVETGLKQYTISEDMISYLKQRRPEEFQNL